MTQRQRFASAERAWLCRASAFEGGIDLTSTRADRAIARRSDHSLLPADLAQRTARPAIDLAPDGPFPTRRARSRTYGNSRRATGSGAASGIHERFPDAAGARLAQCMSAIAAFFRMDRVIGRI